MSNYGRIVYGNREFWHIGTKRMFVHRKTDGGIPFEYVGFDFYVQWPKPGLGLALGKGAVENIGKKRE